jgi:hypothetical protein
MFATMKLIKLNSKMYRQYPLITYLVNSKASVDASAIYFFALDIKSPDRWAHSLGAYSNHTDVFGEIKAM